VFVHEDVHDKLAGACGANRVFVHEDVHDKLAGV
jgi:hypothetical protein